MNQIIQINQMIIKNKKISIVIAVLLLLIITNPSIDEFRSYQHVAPTNYRTYMGRDINFLIFSIYSGDLDGNRENKYLGILGNFFKL